MIDNETSSLFPNITNAAHHPDFGFVCLAAVRYCFGRMTYAPDLVTSFVKDYWFFLTKEDRSRIYKEVREFYGNPTLSKGMDCDKLTWSQFITWMGSQDNL